MTVGRGWWWLFLSLILFLADAGEDEYKCLTCNRTSDLMCYTNSTCGEGQRYCYNYLWIDYNDNYTIYDYEYYLRTWEWGCTDSLETCQQGCSDNLYNRTCNTTTCCDANLTLLSEEYSSENHVAYMMCSSGTIDLINMGLLGAMLVVLERWVAR